MAEEVMPTLQELQARNLQEARLRQEAQQQVVNLEARIQSFEQSQSPSFFKASQYATIEVIPVALLKSKSKDLPV